jgi:hypothetical protein
LLGLDLVVMRGVLGSIRGRVQHADGSPASFVKVAASFRERNGYSFKAAAADEDGRFSIIRVANGAYELIVTTQDESAREQVVVGESDPQELSVIENRLRGVTGPRVRFQRDIPGDSIDAQT